MTASHGVLVVDDHALVRTGVVNIISHETDLRVVAEAANGLEAVNAFTKYRPDVTLLDLRMPVMEGVEAVRQIRELDPNAKVIVLTTYDTDEDISRALKAEAAPLLFTHDRLRVGRRGCRPGRAVPGVSEAGYVRRRASARAVVVPDRTQPLHRFLASPGSSAGGGSGSSAGRLGRTDRCCRSGAWPRGRNLVMALPPRSGLARSIKVDTREER
ncbi:MAG TPA: response regulator transcription factor [Thermoanaerobaculia bacterium]|jgi:CheY-like chemotaxis protein|nr:response regulator transcription factor [Thermoanaerobaculia bacterium]